MTLLMTGAPAGVVIHAYCVEEGLNKPKSLIKLFIKINGMSYFVKELFYTLQGEGAHAGRPAVFCRFSGCNLWSGREENRVTAVCKFCDTDFVGTDGPGGGKFKTPAELVQEAPFLVCTGGEPLLQLDAPLVEALKGDAIEIAIETNGTIVPPPGIDWVCVSPKAGSDCLLKTGDELKVIFPQPGAEPELFADWDFDQFFIQPMDNESRTENTQLAIEYCLANPQWKLSLQTHKILEIP